MSSGHRTTVGTSWQPPGLRDQQNPCHKDTCPTATIAPTPEGASAQHSPTQLSLLSVKSQTDVLSGPPGRCLLTHTCHPSLTTQCSQIFSAPASPPAIWDPSTTSPKHTSISTNACACALRGLSPLCVVSVPVACGKWRSQEETPQMPRAPPFKLLPACSVPR